MTDFTNCPIVPGRAYNGANGSKIAVEYGGGIYMLKFPPSGERKPTNLSYTNSCISEHLASSIFNLIGINAQKTELGTFSIKGKTKVVCACKDFATGSKRLFDFCSIKNTILDSDSNGSGTELEDVMDTMEKIAAFIDGTPVISDLQKQFYSRYLQARYDLILSPAYKLIEPQK